MRYEAPGSAFHVRFDGFDTGLTGTIGVRILDSTGATVAARVTAGIIENPAGSGSYLIALVAPDTVGEYTIFVDDGTVAPTSSRGEQLVVTYTPLAPTPTDAFATVDEFAARIGQDLTVSDQARASVLLALVTGTIQDEAQQHIFLVTDETLTLPGTTDDMIVLPERPVVSVSSVTLDGVELTEGNAWYLDGNALCRVPSNLAIVIDGLVDADIYPLGTGFGWASQTLEIVYTHGYDTPPLTVKNICLDAAARVWFNPGSVARETVGNVSTVYDNMRFSPSGLGLTDDERKALRRLFGRKARSLTMGC